MDALLLAVLDQVVALEDGVTLDLVGGGDDAGGLDEGLDLLPSIVAISIGSVTLGGIRTCSLRWLETPTARALDLGSLVMAFQVSTMEMPSSMSTSPPSTVLLAFRGK